MSSSYRVVNWTASKRAYDVALAAGVALFVLLFVLLGKLALAPERAISDPILLLRALGACAFLMLHVTLCIGPLARLDRRFLPLLYNRRHLGIATFTIALLHALLVALWYHGFGVVQPLESLLNSNVQYGSLRAFPFEALGVIALAILFIMAATSHDFWLHNLSPRAWKRLHMLVYPAYAMLVMHVALGAVQTEKSAVYPLLTGLGAAIVAGLHVAAGRREAARDKPSAMPAETWVDAGCVDEIREGRARTICLPGEQGERVAVYRHQGKISVMTNVCVHQGGPLGEGKIVGGCVTCPWHGYQYLPHNGQSPPPFTEKVATHRVKVEGRRIMIDPRPLPAGTPVEPARFEEVARD